MNAKTNRNLMYIVVGIWGIFFGVCIFTLAMIALPARQLIQSGSGQDSQAKPSEAASLTVPETPLPPAGAPEVAVVPVEQTPSPQAGTSDAETFPEQQTPIPEIGRTTGISAVQRFGNADFDAAVSFYLERRFAEAIPYLDLTIDAMPENGDAYYFRAQSYYQLAQNQRYQNEYEDNISFALNDVDKAITYGVTLIPPGNPYKLRYDIYLGIAGFKEYRADREYLYQIASDNLQAAVSLGTSQAYQEQWIPMALFASNRCDEGMREVVKLQEYYGEFAPPSASIINIEAHGYLCLGQLDKALEYVNKGLDIEIVNGRVWLRAMILYLMGRHEEALEDLDDIIEEKPYYNGYRYYLRALIHYENGRRDLAEQDLMMGAGNTWESWGLYSYVLGLMALDDGDKEAGIMYLQQALATLEWFFRPMFPRIEQELADLGAAPLPEESNVQIRATPMPTTEAIPRPTGPSTINSDGFPELRYIIPVDIAYGTGSIIREDSLYPYPTYRFRPHLPISIESIQSLTIHLEPESADESESFELFLWNITKGDWDMLKPGWGATIIEEPERYVGLNGETYLAIRRDYETEIHIRNVWLTIEVTETNGSQITLGLE